MRKCRLSVKMTVRYVAPQSEVTKFKERPKTSGDITAEEWVTEVRME